MATIVVDTNAALVKALRHANDGDVIALAPGTYSDVILKNISINGNVTITSANPNRPAVLTDLLVKGCEGLTFRNLDMVREEARTDYNFKYRFLDNNNIVIDDVRVKGPDEFSTLKENALMIVRDSSNVTITNSEFSATWHGLTIVDNRNITVADNYFHNIRTDGVRGGGNDNLEISGNLFTDFHPAPGDHPDAIQLWTTFTAQSAQKTLIADNVFVRGAGDPIQGIFINDKDGDKPFLDLDIVGNIILGGRYNGIAVNGVDGGKVTENVVIGFEDQLSWIRVANALDVVVRKNVATRYVTDGDPLADGDGNAIVGRVKDGGAAALLAWLADEPDFADAFVGGPEALFKLLGLTWNGDDDGNGGGNGDGDGDGGGDGGGDPVIVLTGTDRADTMVVRDDGDHEVRALAGNDTLDGGTGAGLHILVGGQGNDTYVVRSARDRVVEDSNAGYDVVTSYIDYRLADGVEALNLAQGGLIGMGNLLDNIMHGSAENDELHGMGGADRIVGGSGEDRITGGTGKDDLRGGLDNDHLYGDDGDDELVGGAGDDYLDGGAGNDMIWGSEGADIMTGGAGNDTFRMRLGDVDRVSTDRITDFQSGIDVVNLSGMPRGRNDVFSFIGMAEFTGKGPQVRYTIDAGSVLVQGDHDGDGRADFAILLDGVARVTARDFIL